MMSSRPAIRYVRRTTDRGTTMEMHQVRYFLAVARVLNFTRAADECNVTQPSLTRAIKLLALARARQVAGENVAILEQKHTEAARTASDR